jgi:hypothetical protein
MSLGRSRRDPQPLGDLDIGASLGDELYDLPLTLCEPNAFAESDHCKAMLPADRLGRYWPLGRSFALNRSAYEGGFVTPGIDGLKGIRLQDAKLDQ